MAESPAVINGNNHRMDNRNPSARITASFNLALFLYVAACGLVRFLLSERAKNVPLQGILISVAIDAVRMVIVISITTYFVREIWNRLITQKCAAKELNTQEAMSLVLAVAMLAS